jgi:hypothetical protein
MSSGETDRLRFPFIDLYVSALTPRIHCSESALQFAENMTFEFLSRVNKCIVREQSKMSSRCRGAACRPMFSLYNIGARTEPWSTPAAIFLGVENSPSTETLQFLSVRKEAISLMRLVENSTSDNLYSRPECHVVSKGFSIPKNTAASTYYWWNLGSRDRPASYIEVSYCYLLESQTDLHLVSFFPQCVFVYNT